MLAERRQQKSIGRTSALLLMVWVACGCAAPVYEATVDQDDALTGTVLARSEKLAKRVSDGMADVGRRASQRFDPCNPLPDNLAELSIAAREKPTPVGEYDLYRAVRLAIDWARATDGAFDLTAAAGDCPERVPLTADWRTIRLFPEMEAVSLLDASLRLDLSGLSDGYILDEAIRSTALIGVVGAKIHRGRVTLASGRNHDDDPWSASFDVGGLQAETELDGQALAYRSADVAPADVLAVVTWASSAADADALAESLWNAGSASAARWLAEADRMQALLLVQRADRAYWLASGSLAARLSAQNPESKMILKDTRFLLPPATR